MEDFVPHPFWKGPHRQTLAAYFVGALRPVPIIEGTRTHHVALDDGDRLALHDDSPTTWRSGDPVCLMIHGLAGCHASAYMVRIARKLLARGVRVFRMDLRGCGAGALIAKYSYHAGRTDDLEQAVAAIRAVCPGSPMGIVGFSLGGNLVLKWLGERGDAASSLVARAVAVSPPIELERCVRALSRGWGPLYDRYFARLLWRQLQQRRQRLPDLAWPNGLRRPSGLFDFDARYTAPLGGFASAEDYYARSSAASLIPHIAVPTVVIASRDDPIALGNCWDGVNRPSVLVLKLTNLGGHLGFWECRVGDSDGFWMDRQVVSWIVGNREGRVRWIPDGST
jgi:predicted alpha/beta-fold hydrolase